MNAPHRRAPGAAPEPVAVHLVKFERNIVTGQWRASCSCYWCVVGSEGEVKMRAATHDLEWEKVG